MSMSTATATINSNPPYMYSSISSLSSAQNQPPSVTRVYKQAAQLFLTRRIKESLEVIEVIITKPEVPKHDGRESGEEQDAAAIALASRGARIKVWSLYISMINAVVEMGVEEGKRSFGLARWKKLVAKAKEGTVWSEIVREGYGGMEGNVDADVVANLATLLLAHAPSQKTTQQRLETYLSASTMPPVDAPKDLNSRSRVLEIYLLHVLPRNAEWDYAREFIKMSQELDEERRDAFLQALVLLQEAPKHEKEREREIQRQRQQKLKEMERQEEARKAEEKRAMEQQESKRRQDLAKTRELAKNVDSRPPDKVVRSNLNSNATENSKGTKQPMAGKQSGPQSSNSSTPAKKPPSPPPTLYQRASLTLQALQRNLIGMGRGLSKQPMALLRMIVFLLALIMALARRDVRERLQRARDAAWNNVRRTIGMGVKVSYI